MESRATAESVWGLIGLQITGDLEVVIYYTTDS